VRLLSGLFSVLGSVVEGEARLLEERVAHFLQAQMKALRRAIMHLLVACFLLALGYALLLAACGLALWGIFALISPGVGQTGAAFITGGVALLAGAILVMIACRLEH
jgi:polyferredoxin